MLPFVLLLLPLFVLAAPSQGELESRSTPIRPKPPGNFVGADKYDAPIGYKRMDDTFKAVGITGNFHSLCGDCARLQDTVVAQYGEWHGKSVKCPDPS